MFRHPAKKLKATAMVLAILGAIASVALGAGILLNAVKIRASLKMPLGLGILLGGLALSWTVGLVLHGFGELIEKTKDNNYLISRVASHTKSMLEDQNTPKA